MGAAGFGGDSAKPARRGLLLQKPWLGGHWFGSREKRSASGHAVQFSAQNWDVKLAAFAVHGHVEDIARLLHKFVEEPRAQVPLDVVP